MDYLDFSASPNFSKLNTDLDWQKEMIYFWDEWKNENDYIIVNTSGSTGSPKPVKLMKASVLASAKMTSEFFNLKESQSALLCLPVQYIAGKMMMVRAEYARMKLYYTEPKLNVELNQEIDFAAMTPSQCQTSISNVPNIKTLILGGNKVSIELENQLKPLKINVYETYGMTETISHIAVRDLKDDSSGFKPLDGVEVNINEEGNVEISAPHISKEVISTSDIGIVKKDGTFEVHGRTDNIVNSGGVKISPEVLEHRLESETGVKGMFYGESDQQLGERLVLVVQGAHSLNTAVFQRLGFKKHEIPKEIHQVDELAKTKNGKLDRVETIKKLKNNFEK